MKSMNLLYVFIVLLTDGMRADQNPIVEAIKDENKSMEEIRQIIQEHIEKINVEDEASYMTPIAQALKLITNNQNRKQEIIKLILSYDPWIDTSDIYDASADREVLDSVLANKIDINMKASKSGRTALSMAINGPSSNLLKVKNLLERGADVDTIDIVGNTPLISTILTLSPQEPEKVSDAAHIIKLLLEKKNNSNRVNKNGETALSLALNKFSQDAHNNRYYEIFDVLFDFLDQASLSRMVSGLKSMGKTQKAEEYEKKIDEKINAPLGQAQLIKSSFIQLDRELGLLSQRLKKG